MYDVIIIGSGPGGLVSGVNLTKNGFKVLILDSNFYYGGTSYVFKRRGYIFPMGPLSFSSPAEIKALFIKLGIREELQFNRNHFQLITPAMDIVYSQPFHILQDKLIKIFVEEQNGIKIFFDKLKELMKALHNIHEWHPAYRLRKSQPKEPIDFLSSQQDAYRLLEEYSQVPAKEFLQRFIKNDNLRRFFGTLGTDEPKMSMVLLGMMWCLIAEKGIWFPSCGVHGVSDTLYETFISNGGEIKLKTPVDEILIKNGRCYGVRTRNGTIFKTKWVISNADYKSTFLKLIDPTNISSAFRNIIEKIPYFESEFCIYLGIDPSKIDLTKVRAQHLFYRKEIRDNGKENLEDFDNREVEICFWSDNDPSFAPPDKKGLVFRVAFPYTFFAKWKTGERQRKDGYKEYKQDLANKLIATVEHILPGLSSSIELIDISTPLTYEEFGQRFHGSIAGWSWAIHENLKLENKLLIETPIPNLLMVGLYAAAELFLGGVPTAMHTGYWASELIIKRVKS